MIKITRDVHGRGSSPKCNSLLPSVLVRSRPAVSLNSDIGCKQHRALTADSKSPRSIILATAVSSCSSVLCRNQADVEGIQPEVVDV